jgi:predicted nucleic acid-binding Zn ribbon protein
VEAVALEPGNLGQHTQCQNKIKKKKERKITTEMLFFLKKIITMEMFFPKCMFYVTDGHCSK